MGLINDDEKCFMNILKALVNSDDSNTHEVSTIEFTTSLWSKIGVLAQYHNVFPLVVEAVASNATFVKLPEYSKCIYQTMPMVAEQVRKTEGFLFLYQLFVKEGIHPLVMKGLICRELYGQYKEHRPSGDEDILIKKQDYESVQRILREQGFRSDHENVISEAQLDELQEVTFYNPESRMTIEVHTNPIGRENNWHRKANECFSGVFEHVRDVEINGIKIRTMSHTEHLLFLVLHTLKHFTIGGVGIRQVLDILLYMKQYGRECDWDFITHNLYNLRADLFFTDLICIGNQYLGFDLHPFLLEPNCPDRLLKDMLESGIFGNSTEVQRNVGIWTSAAIEKGQSKSNRFQEIIYVIFPSKARLLSASPELAEKPWRLPLCWIKRWMRIIKRNSVNGNNLIIESKKLSQQRIELLKSYKIL